MNSLAKSKLNNLYGAVLLPELKTGKEGGSVTVQWLGLSAFTAVAQVQFLIKGTPKEVAVRPKRKNMFLILKNKLKYFSKDYKGIGNFLRQLLVLQDHIYLHVYFYLYFLLFFLIFLTSSFQLSSTNISIYTQIRVSEFIKHFHIK